MVGTNSGFQLTVRREPPDTSIGTLTIPSVSMADSGNYTCAPASLQVASVMLHVVIGELNVQEDRRKDPTSFCQSQYRERRVEREGKERSDPKSMSQSRAFLP